MHVLNVLADFPDQDKMDTFSEWKCREREQVRTGCRWVCCVCPHDVLLNFILIFFLLCGVGELDYDLLNVDLHTICLEEINIIFCFFIRIL